MALGLCRYERAAEDLRARLQRSKGQEKLAVFLCIGLALMGDLGARDDIHEIVSSSVRRPELLRQAAIALGRLGDKSVTRSLQQRLLEKEASIAEHAAIASALGFIGDRGTIAPLQQMLADTSLSELSRAFAAVALSDPFGRGWNLIGTADHHVHAGIAAGSAAAWIVWNLQAGAIIAGHVLAVLVAHGLAFRLYPDARAAALSQLPLTLLMIGYTVFGLWLLSTPTAG